MRMLKRLGLMTLALSSMVAAFAAAISFDVSSTSDMGGYDKKISINIRVMDFENITKYTDNFDENKYIEVWYGRQHKEELIPYKTSRVFKETTSRNTLGGLIEQINEEMQPTENADIFKLLPEELGDAGQYGRYLNGVRKTRAEIVSQKDPLHNLYWGYHEEYNTNGGWKQANEWFHSYLSITSPNSPEATKKSHEGFDLQETFYAYDNRFGKGIDYINLHNDDIININTWRMV